MSAKVIEIMKAKMSLEERQRFVANCLKRNPDWEKVINGKELFEIWFNENSFAWIDSKEGFMYWEGIYIRFTDEELKEKINV